ncbi:hypothetical protein KM043_008574 [Ampulex compressa]|nr:hypothetical protein KM043_008574 [Ampulex compressa]
MEEKAGTVAAGPAISPTSVARSVEFFLESTTPTNLPDPQGRNLEASSTSDSPLDWPIPRLWRPVFPRSLGNGGQQGRPWESRWSLHGAASSYVIPRMSKSRLPPVSSLLQLFPRSQHPTWSSTTIHPGLLEGSSAPSMRAFARILAKDRGSSRMWSMDRAPSSSPRIDPSGAIGPLCGA